MSDLERRLHTGSVRICDTADRTMLLDLGAGEFVLFLETGSDGRLRRVVIERVADERQPTEVTP